MNSGWIRAVGTCVAVLILIALPAAAYAADADSPGPPRATPDMLAHPPATPKPFLPLIKDASGHYHYMATFLRDYTELVFIVQEEGHHGIVSGLIGDADAGHVYPYTAGGGPSRGISADDRSPCYSRAQDRIYFISGRETPDGSGYKARGIWYAERRADGAGNSDLHVVFRRDDQDWSDPVKLPATVNTEAGELYPRLSSDGKALFFSRIQPETDDDWNEHYETQWVSTELVSGLRP